MTPAVRWTSVAIGIVQLACIVLGSFALNFAPTRTAKAVFRVAALLCVAAMVAIARAREAAGRGARSDEPWDRA